MTLSPRRKMRAVVLLSGLVTGGCVIGDAMASSGPKAVSIAVTSDTVLSLSAPESQLVVSVVADGKVVSEPDLIVTTADNGVVAVAAGGDSLIANHIGRTEITIQVRGALLTDSLPTLVQSFRVLQ